MLLYFFSTLQTTAHRVQITRRRLLCTVRRARTIRLITAQARRRIRRVPNTRPRVPATAQQARRIAPVLSTRRKAHRATTRRRAQAIRAHQAGLGTVQHTVQR